jgi:hypothetical protein
MKTTRLRLPLLILFTLTLAHAQDVRSGEDVLRAMHDRFAKSWYETLTFTQKSTTYNPDGTSKVDMWHEALALPGKLRIDIGPPSDGNGFLLVDGTLTIFREGKGGHSSPGEHASGIGIRCLSPGAVGHDQRREERRLRPQEVSRGNLGGETGLRGGRGEGRSEGEAVLGG